MDSFLEQFINGVYQEAQAVLSYFFGYPPYRCTIIKFGGFCYSHNWYGKTNFNHDKVGKLLEQLAEMQKKSHPTLAYLKRYSH